MTITAFADNSAVSGRWSRPDVTVVGYRKFTLLPDKYFEICSFEVEATDAWDVTAIHEASAHGRFVTRPYALFVLGKPVANLSDREKEVLQACREEAARLRIGLVVVTKVNDYQTWDILVEAERHEPDPERMQKFLDDSLSASERDAVVMWFR